MYICICRAVTEKAIRHAVEAGMRSLPELNAHLGVAAECGSCQCAAEELLEETLETRGSLPPHRRCSSGSSAMF